MPFAPIERAIEDVRAGKLVLIADDEDRENEGDLVTAAQHITPETINFMTKHGRGLICLTLTPERCRALGLPQMSEENSEAHETAFTVSIDAAARFGVTTGISAWDRAKTILVAIDPATEPSDLRRPGHVFPLRARRGGVLQRVGQTEASVDLARLAGLYPAGVICEVLADDGSMMRREQLELFAEEHDIAFITVAQLVSYRLQHERLVHRVAEARLPTGFGDFRVIGYRNDVDGAEHVALVYGVVAGRENVLVRMHSKCLTGDVFGSARCDCGWQLQSAMQMIAKEGAGVIVYLDQEGRGIGLLNRTRASTRSRPTSGSASPPICAIMGLGRRFWSISDSAPSASSRTIRGSSWGSMGTDCRSWSAFPLCTPIRRTNVAPTWLRNATNSDT